MGLLQGSIQAPLGATSDTAKRTNQNRAVDKVVAQVSNLLYRRASSLPAVRTISRTRTFGRSADWKSAIQQVGNLRYGELVGLCQCPWEQAQDEFVLTNTG